ncbi:MAG: hypothetical protein K2J91_02370 [Lachnospiraceae bacterium]|nr:hypothetical protein [Lachnospiraceae bacterium]
MYERDSDGSFTVANSGAVYNKAYVNLVTGKFTQYAEKSKIQYMPGMENVKEQKMLDQTCFVYSVS